MQFQTPIKWLTLTFWIAFRAWLGFCCSLRKSLERSHLGQSARVERGWAQPARVERGWAQPARVERGWAQPARVERGWAQPARVERGWAQPARVERGWAQPAWAQPAWALPLPVRELPESGSSWQRRDSSPVHTWLDRNFLHRIFIRFAFEICIPRALHCTFLLT